MMNISRWVAAARLRSSFSGLAAILQVSSSCEKTQYLRRRR